jgi:hypothetical protein
MAAIQLISTDLEIFDGIGRMFVSNSIKSTKLTASTLSHSHFVIQKVGANTFKGCVSGTKKFNFEIKTKKSGILFSMDPIDNADATEIRALIVKLIIKQDSDRELFAKKDAENKKRRASGQEEIGLDLKPPVGFSVRSSKQIHPRFLVSQQQSEKNYATAVKCGYFHTRFATYAKKRGLLCIFKSA